MPLDRLNNSLLQELELLENEGRAKTAERIIMGYVPPNGEKGPRYFLEGSENEFIRMNSNSYLSLSDHPKLVAAADEATRRFGVGPGAVRFIDGTYEYHVYLEKKIADFLNKPAAKIFNSAYTSTCGLALSITNQHTFWIGDELNHNCIIRAMRIANVSSQNKAIYKHNDLNELRSRLNEVPQECDRVILVFDGVFSMRGDYVRLDEIKRIVEEHHPKFKDGVITVMDDSHGIGAYGETGRGTSEAVGGEADVVIGTFGKAFGVNGGFIAASEEIAEAIRQKADTYIYTNPLGVADCAAAVEAIEICDSSEGLKRLRDLKERTQQFRAGIASLGMESIPGLHPIVPLLVRDTGKAKKMVRHLFEEGILVVGLTFPVVPKGDDTIRFQINASHTSQDVDYVLQALSNVK